MCGKLRDQPPPTLLQHQLLPLEQATVQLAGAGAGEGEGGTSDAGLVTTCEDIYMLCNGGMSCLLSCSCHDAGSLSLEHSITGRLSGTESLYLSTDPHNENVNLCYA